MRTLARYAARGFVTGFFATALTLLLLPHFYSRIHELLVFPAAAAVAGVLIGTVSPFPGNSTGPSCGIGSQTPFGAVATSRGWIPTAAMTRSGRTSRWTRKR